MKKRILFVDDEPNILSSMKRMLRGLRKEVSMGFVESGKAALEAMAEAPYDVVISDMRMPGMDGAELLASIRDSWPLTIRILLTGQADSDSLLRTADVVHKFLLKPCEQDEIKKTIERACALHAFLVKDGEVSLEGDFLKLIPVLPQVYQDVQELLLADECSSELVAECLSGDEWMALSMQKLCSVVDSSVSSPSATMLDAVHELGLDVLRPLVLSLYLFQRLTESVPDDPSFERILMHGMRVGQYARKIVMAEKGGASDVANAFIGGLLHDIGYLVLANIQPESFVGRFSQVLKGDELPLDSEQELFALSHVEAGALLLVTLGFPIGVIEIVAYHHRLDCYFDQRFGGLTAVHVADSLLGALDSGPSCFKAEIDYEYLTRIQCQDKLAAWKAILQIDS